MTAEISFSDWVDYLTPSLDFGADTLIEAIDKAHRRGAMNADMAERLAKLFGVSDEMCFGLGALTAALELGAAS